MVMAWKIMLIKSHYFFLILSIVIKMLNLNIEHWTQSFCFPLVMPLSGLVILAGQAAESHLGVY